MAERLKGPDLDVFELGPGGEKRPLKSPAEDQALFEREMDAQPRERQAIIDEFMGADPKNQQTTHESMAETAEHVFRMEKAAHRLITEFPDAVTKRLAPHGFKVKGLLPSGDGNGYILYANDAEGRPFNITLGLDDTSMAFCEYGESMGVRLVSLVEERILAARKRYFERMGGDPGGPSRLVTL